MKIRCLILLLLAICPVVQAGQSSDSKARELFDKVYEKVWGPQGSSLRYSVNLIGIYKTEGTIVYKKEKLHYIEKRYMAWEDGVTAYMVDSKKREVGIYRFDDDKKDNYLAKFKFDANDFYFSYREDAEYYYITAKLRKSSLFGVKWVEAKVIKTSFVPVSLVIKLAFIHTTVQISDFKSGGISDDAFVFPQERFKDYEIIDYRN